MYVCEPNTLPFPISTSSPLIVMESLVVPASDVTSHLYSPASSAVNLSIEITDPTLSPVGVVHVTLRVGPPTASQVKFRGLPWETPVEGLAVRFTITGATTDITGEGGEGEGQRLDNYDHEWATMLQPLWTRVYVHLTSDSDGVIGCSSF